MAYMDNQAKQAGVKKEIQHLPILNEIFKPAQITLIASTPEENKQKKVDYWGIQKSTNIIWAFDFKTAKSPEKGFCLTFKINGSSQNSFEVGEQDITSIFLLEHLHQYAFVSKKDIYNWFKQNMPPCYPCKTRGDNSTFFFFPTSAIFELAKKIKEYKTN